MTVQGGGNLSLGAAVGVLTINNTLTLQANSTVVMKLDRTHSPSSDRLSGMSAMTFGGALMVINVGPEFQGGETFTLFDAVSQSGAFSAPNLPTLGEGLNWWTTDNYASVTVNRAPVASPLSLGAQSATPVTIQILGGKHPPPTPMTMRSRLRWASPRMAALRRTESMSPTRQTPTMPVQTPLPTRLAMAGAARQRVLWRWP